MMEPVAGENLLAAAISGAMVVLSGAGYALLFALSRLLNKPAMMPVAYSFYALLAGSVMVLAQTLSLDHYWWVLVAIMLVGYLLAPHGIWQLCVATHADTTEPGSSSTTSAANQISIHTLHNKRQQQSNQSGG